MIVENNFTIPIINQDCSLLVYDDALEILKMFPENRFDNDPRDVDGGVFQIENIMYLILERPEITHGIIAHEINHLMNYAFNWIEYFPDSRNDELQSYFLQWVTDEVYSHIDTSKIIK